MTYYQKGKHRSQMTHQYVQSSPGRPVQLVKPASTRLTGPPNQPYSVNETRPLPPLSQNSNSEHRRFQNGTDNEKHRDMITFTSHQLLNHLAVNPKEVYSWKADAQAAFGRLTTNQRRRGASLLYSDKFRDFFTSSAHCGILVVHGRDEDSFTAEPYSCLSAPLMKMYDWLCSKEITVPLPFFCGHMIRNYGSTAGVINKMLRSIIYATVCLKADADYSFPGLRGRRLRDMKVSYLCMIMEHAFTQAIDTRKFADGRRDVIDVTILIDGAHLLETEENIDDFRCFTDTLKRLVQYAQNRNEEDRAMGVRYDEDVIRVTLLYPNDSKYAHNLVSNEGLLEIRSGHVENAHSHGSFESAADLPNPDAFGPPRRSQR